MTRAYVTRDGDMVDEVVWRHYAEADKSVALALVYEANPGLADLGPALPGGVTVALPDVQAPIAEKQTRIWGR